jgi:hypothetical protein
LYLKYQFAHRLWVLTTQEDTRNGFPGILVVEAVDGIRHLVVETINHRIDQFDRLDQREPLANQLVVIIVLEPLAYLPMVGGQ